MFPSSFLPQEGQCSKEHIKFRSLVLIPADGVLETEKCFWDCNELCTSFTPVYALRHKRQTYHVELHNYNAALFIGDNSSLILLKFNVFEVLFIILRMLMLISRELAFYLAEKSKKT